MLRSLILGLILPAFAFCADISGSWSMAVDTDMGSGSPTFQLKQDGEKITGRYTGALGEANVTGTLKGDAIELHFEISPGADAMKVVYSGKLNGDNKMKGTVDLGGQAKGTFTGERKESPAR